MSCYYYKREEYFRPLVLCLKLYKGCFLSLWMEVLRSSNGYKVILSVTISIAHPWPELIFWQFDTFISFWIFLSHSRTKLETCCCKRVKFGAQLNSHCPSLCLRFGKNRRDERPDDRMERKGSSKSKSEDMQVSEETLQMRLEQERWVARHSLGNTVGCKISKQPN